MAAMLHRAPCRPVGIDVSATMLHAASRRLGGRAQYELAPVQNMPSADETFDAVLALNVLYFADEGGTMVTGLHNVLKPGGRLVGFVTHRGSMKSWSFAKQGLHRMYDAHELAAMMVLAGFGADQIKVQEVRVTRSIRGLLVHALKD